MDAEKSQTEKRKPHGEMSPPELLWDRRRLHGDMIRRSIKDNINGKRTWIQKFVLGEDGNIDYEASDANSVMMEQEVSGVWRIDTVADLYQVMGGIQWQNPDLVVTFRSSPKDKAVIVEVTRQDLE